MRSSGVFKGSMKLGPSPVFISTFIPIASGTLRISWNIMAASKSNRQIGYIEISTTLSTILIQSKKSIPSQAALNSGKYQPAYLIAHTGYQGSSFP